MGTITIRPCGPYRVEGGVLKTKGVPARLVYYPDENQWVLNGQNSKFWYGEVLGWFARWLK